MAPRGRLPRYLTRARGLQGHHGENPMRNRRKWALCDVPSYNMSYSVQQLGKRSLSNHQYYNHPCQWSNQDYGGPQCMQITGSTSSYVRNKQRKRTSNYPTIHPNSEARYLRGQLGARPRIQLLLPSIS